ncbi:hypothetical protein HRG_014468 [Hirsutella rhossiliensis]
MQTTKPILTLSSLAGVETVDARYPPLEASTGRILSAWEQEEHRANPELVSRPPETQKKKRKGTGTTIMNKRSNTLASVSSRVDDLAQQIGDFIKSQAAVTGTSRRLHVGTAAGTVSRDGYGAFPAARGSEDTAPYKTSRQAGHKFVPYVPRPPPRRTDPSSQSQSQSQR